MDKKVLVVYYSRTGITKKVAQRLKELLKCDIEEVLDKKDRAGALGYMFAGRDAMKKSLTEIECSNIDPSGYDLVVIGTPVWAFTMSTPIRTYISQNKGKFKQVAFFCTMGGSGHDGTFKDMEELCGIKPVGTIDLLTKEVAKNQYEEKIEEFIKKLQ